MAQTTINIALQEVKKAHEVSVSLKAPSEITILLSKSSSSKGDIMIPLTMLKDSLSLAGKNVNTSISLEGI